MIQFKEAISGQHYFVLKANNNEIVGTSQMYDTKQSRKSGADALLKATCEYWKKSLATLIEERAESQYAEKADVLTVPEIVRLLMGLSNEDMQKIIDRMPYTE